MVTHVFKQKNHQIKKKKKKKKDFKLLKKKKSTNAYPSPSPLSQHPLGAPYTMVPVSQAVPLLKGSNLFSKTSLASVPSSIRSSLVMTPMVRRPERAQGDRVP
jgi:hypothetical protein